MKGVFVTGANGIVGSRLVKEYLEQGDYKVFALVRGSSQEHAEERMSKVLDFWDVPLSDYKHYVRILKGDVCEKNLGLTTAQIDEIKNEVSLFIHAASNTRLNLALEEARRTILGGTKNAYSVAQQIPALERFGFVSTLEVVGDYQDVVYEEFLTHYKRNFLNTYESVKSETEEVLRQEIENDKSITVFRLGMVVGEASTGKALGFQSFYMMLEKMLLKPDFPILPWGCPVDVIPVDVMAEGMVKLMEYSEAQGRVYNLSQGLHDRVSFRELIDKVQPIAEQKLGRAIKRPIYVNPRGYRIGLEILKRATFGKLKRFFTIQLIFIRFLSLDWKFDNEKLATAFAKLGVKQPRFDEFLPTLMDYYFEHREENKLPF